MCNYGIKQPVVCCIINRATTIRIIWKSDSDSNLLISTDSSSVVSYLNRYRGTHFQECVSLSEESFLGRMPWVQIQAYHFPGYTNVLTNSLFMRVKMIQIECVLDDFWIFYSDSGVQSNLSLITITNDGFVLQQVWTTSLSFSTFLGMDWTVCLVLWPWFFRWCRWIIWLLRLLWFFNL